MDSSKYTTWTYGPNDQLLQVRSAFSTNVISQYDSTYDSAGRRVAIIRSGLAMSETRADEYNYNIRGELISAIKNTKGTKVLEYQYQYDDIGNRISSYDLGTNRTYTANNLNQYTSISNSASSALSAGEFIPQFDDDGNQTLIQTATGIWQVQYNGENHPVVWQCVSTNSSTPNSATPPLISMSYDRLGRRVTKNDQRFVYDGYLQIANFEEAVTNSQLTTLNSQLFIWDPTELVATRPLVWNSDNCTSVYTHDGNKNVSEVINSDDVTVAHYEYTPFGAVAKQYGDCAVANPWRFSSEYGEDALGLIYYNYRHLQYNIGRWIIRDAFEELYPQVIAIGFVNLYSFVSNQSTDSFDLRGLDRPGCDIVGAIPGWESDCRLKCCAKHDQCYYENKCTAWSWFGLLNPFSCPSKCDDCNIEVVICTISCFGGHDPLPPSPWEKPKPNGGKYYCATRHSYVSDPKDCPRK